MLAMKLHVIAYVRATVFKNKTRFYHCLSYHDAASNNQPLAIAPTRLFIYLFVYFLWDQLDVGQGQSGGQPVI